MAGKFQHLHWVVTLAHIAPGYNYSKESATREKSSGGGMSRW